MRLSSLAVLLAAGAAPTAKTEITWYGHAAFTLRTPAGAALAIDPWQPGETRAS